MKKLMFIVMVLGLVSSASALTVGVGETLTFTARQQIMNLTGVGEGGQLLIDGGTVQSAFRIDHDKCDVVIQNGGQFLWTNTYKLPDNNGPSNLYILDGLAKGNDIEVFGDARMGKIYIGAAGVLELAIGIGNTNTKYNPVDWMKANAPGDPVIPGYGTLNLDPSLGAGWSLKLEELGGTAFRVTAVPEPATMMLLGLGGLLLRRRK